MKHRTGILHSWEEFTAWLAQAEGDGWHLVAFQVVPKDARTADIPPMKIYAAIAKGRPE